LVNPKVDLPFSFNPVLGATGGFSDTSPHPDRASRASTLSSSTPGAFALQLRQHITSSVFFLSDNAKSIVTFRSQKLAFN
jgi:hypothetical protein